MREISFLSIIVLIITSSLATAEDKRLLPLQQFELREDTDFAGGDIPAALGHPSLRQITAEQCAAVCLAIPECTAFTYNENKRVCFPKQRISEAAVFRGALSGIRTPIAAQPVVDNGFSPFLLKSSCAEVKREVDAFASKARIRFPVDRLRIGELSHIGFGAPKVPHRLPAFLVFSFDQAVRFKGKGFYALTPSAKGAFNSKHALGTTRAIVPLFPRNRSEGGTFAFVPLSLSKMKVTAAVVAQTGCGEVIRQIAVKQFDLPEVQSPKIFVFDQYGATSPKSSILSPKGDRYINVFDDFFRIIATATDAPIAEERGRFPRFSPTGRFVTAELENGVAVFDAVDGAAMDFSGMNLAWDVDDSFAIADQPTWAQVHVSSTLVSPMTEGPGEMRSVGFSCHYCAGVENVAVKLDLENNFLLAQDQNPVGDNPEYANSLTTEAFENSQSALLFVAANAGIVPTKLPTQWETRGPLVFTNLAAARGGRPLSELTGSDAILAKKFLATPKFRPFAPGAQTPTASRAARLLAQLGSRYGFTVSQTVMFEEVEQAFRTAEPQDYPQHPAGGLPDRNTLRFDECGTSTLSTGVGTNGTPSVEVDRVNFWKVASSSGPISLLGFSCNGGTNGQFGSIQAIYSSKHPYAIKYVNFDLAFSNISAGVGCEECGFQAGLVDDRYVVARTSFYPTIAVYDIERNIVSSFPAYRGELMEQLYLSSDHRHLLQINSDGTFAIYANSNEGKHAKAELLTPSVGGNEQVAPNLLLAGRYDDDELVLWTPTGFYEATYEASRQIALKFNGSDAPFAFDQFAAASARPKLFEDVLRGVNPGKAKPYQVPPIVAVRYESSRPDQVSTTLEQLGGSRAIEASVYQDGTLTMEVALDEEKTSWKLNVPRRADARWISVIVTDATGLTSSPQGHDMGPARSKREITLLAVAVDEYDDSRLAGLNFSKTDAFSFSEALRSYVADGQRTFREMAIADAQATKEKVLAEIIAAVSQSGPNDVVLYFSGHGLTDQTGRLFLALKNTNLDDLAGTALSWTEIATATARSSARITVVLDACHSGEAGASMFATNDDLAGNLLNASTSPITILAASKGRQTSIEDSAAGGGLFTRALVDALTERKVVTDADGNGALEVSEIYRAIKSRVSSDTDGRQTPWLASNRAVGQIPLF